MDYRKLIESMTPEIYRSLRRSVELGKWPDGRPLSREQRRETMQAVIAWGELHLPEAERVGYIDKGHKEGDNCDDPQDTPLKWQ